MLKDKINPDDFEFEERMIKINRVMRVGKGRRTPSFNSLTVVGNRDGIVGIGFGSASEVAGALRKSFADAEKISFGFQLPMVHFRMRSSANSNLPKFC